jgi:hypothetical protein
MVRNQPFQTHTSVARRFRPKGWVGLGQGKEDMGGHSWFSEQVVVKGGDWVSIVTIILVHLLQGIKMSGSIHQWIMEDMKQYAETWGGTMGRDLIAKERKCRLVEVEMHL